MKKWKWKFHFQRRRRHCNFLFLDRVFVFFIRFSLSPVLFFSIEKYSHFRLSLSNFILQKKKKQKIYMQNNRLKSINGCYTRSRNKKWKKNQFDSSILFHLQNNLIFEIFFFLCNNFQLPSLLLFMIYELFCFSYSRLICLWMKNKKIFEINLIGTKKRK